MAFEAAAGRAAAANLAGAMSCVAGCACEVRIDLATRLYNLKSHKNKGEHLVKLASALVNVLPAQQVSSLGMRDAAAK